MVPVYPERIIVVLLPVQTDASVAAAVPPTLCGSTVTVAGVELAAEQTPLVTTAR